MKKSSLLDISTKKQASKSTKKSLSKTQKHDFDDIESLSTFKQKKIENIDDKFMLLKSELNSLFCNSSTKPSENLSENPTKSRLTEDCIKFKNETDSSMSSSPKPSKFSEWLNETIENMDAKFPNSKIDKKSDCEESVTPTGKLGLKSKYNMTLLPKHKVERLLYKSFQLQNLGIYVLSSSDDSEEEQKSSKNKKQNKKTSKKGNKRRTRAFSTAFPRKNFKRKKASLDSDVEIINVEESFQKNEHDKVNYVDLDVESYDWSEPFCTKSASDCSDLEIIENSESEPVLNTRKPNDNVKTCVQDNALSTAPADQNADKNFTSPEAKRTWECPICFEASKGQSIVATLCGHIFCKACLEEHKSAHGKLCPTCRFDLSDKPPIILFNI